MPRSKCIIILSEKSSGSSACQNLLAKFARIKHVSVTRHFENETLYWTKAASILGLPQSKMLDSEVPFGREKARAELIALLQDNLESYAPPDFDWELIMGGWRLLCQRFAPIFLEKSPHHLFQWSALELILACMKEVQDTDFLLIGLVRNPMDTIYSQFKRWRTRPEQLQIQWCVAYQNLLRLQELAGDRLVIVRYEDMVSSLACLLPVFEFCDVPINAADKGFLHAASLLKWKTDRLYGFQLSDDAATLARRFGYQDHELQNGSNLLWPLRRELARAMHKITEPIIVAARSAMKHLGQRQRTEA